MARDFDGSTDRLDFASGIDLSALSGLTMSCWLNPVDLSGSSAQYLSSFHSSGSATTSWNGVSGSPAITFYAIMSGTDIYRTFTSDYMDGQWQNYIVTWTGSLTASTINMYRNGSSLTQTGAQDGTGTVSSSDSHTIGGRESDDLRNIEGRIAEHGIWDVVLSAGQIAMLADGYSPDMVAPESLISYTPLVRGLEDRITGASGTADGTTVYEHPRIIRPSAQILQFPPVAVGAGGRIMGPIAGEGGLAGAGGLAGRGGGMAG